MATRFQAYSRKSGAKRAVVTDLEQDAIEGRDCLIERQLNGRYAYRRLNPPTKPDIVPTSILLWAQPFKHKGTMSGPDKRDK